MRTEDTGLELPKNSERLFRLYAEKSLRLEPHSRVEEHASSSYALPTSKLTLGCFSSACRPADMPLVMFAMALTMFIAALDQTIVTVSQLCSRSS